MELMTAELKAWRRQADALTSAILARIDVDGNDADLRELVAGLTVDIETLPSSRFDIVNLERAALAIRLRTALSMTAPRGRLLVRAWESEDAIRTISTVEGVGRSAPTWC